MPAKSLLSTFCRQKASERKQLDLKSITPTGSMSLQDELETLESWLGIPLNRIPLASMPSRPSAHLTTSPMQLLSK